MFHGLTFQQEQSTEAYSGLFSHNSLFLIDDDLLGNPTDRNLQQTFSAGQAGLK